MKQFLVFLGQLLTLTALWGNSSSGTLWQTDACNKSCFTAAPVSEEVQQVRFLSFSWIPGKRTGNRGFTIMRMGEGPREVDKEASCVNLRLSPNLFCLLLFGACFVVMLLWELTRFDQNWSSCTLNTHSETGEWNYFIEVFLFLHCRFVKWAFLCRVSGCILK